MFQIRYEPHLSDKAVVLRRPGVPSQKYGMPIIWSSDKKVWKPLGLIIPYKSHKFE